MSYTDIAPTPKSQICTHFSLETIYLEVRLELSLASDVAGGAVERAAERKEVSEGHGHDLEAPVLEGLDGGGLVRLHDHAVL